mmetsp:Transcript_73892/g.228294  ORF Transcript_73892/g.228294 Transcript_73892/m.228294 type:complete len:293 (-) Transcript_73892:1539-2417(-)
MVRVVVDHGGHHLCRGRRQTRGDEVLLRRGEGLAVAPAERGKLGVQVEPGHRPDLRVPARDAKEQGREQLVELGEARAGVEGPRVGDARGHVQQLLGVHRGGHRAEPALKCEDLRVVERAQLAPVPLVELQEVAGHIPHQVEDGGAVRVVRRLPQQGVLQGPGIPQGLHGVVHVVHAGPEGPHGRCEVRERHAPPSDHLGTHERALRRVVDGDGAPGPASEEPPEGMDGAERLAGGRRQDVGHEHVCVEEVLACGDDDTHGGAPDELPILPLPLGDSPVSALPVRGSPVGHG